MRLSEAESPAPALNCSPVFSSSGTISQVAGSLVPDSGKTQGADEEGSVINTQAELQSCAPQKQFFHRVERGRNFATTRISPLMWRLNSSSSSAGIQYSRC
jgi:hypothetical protein